MKLNTSVFYYSVFVFLFGICSASAQVEENETKEKKKSAIQLEYYAFHPKPISDTFLKEAFDVKSSLVGLGLKYVHKNKYNFGLGYECFKGSVLKTELVGNFSSVNVFNYIFLAGYKIDNIFGSIILDMNLKGGFTRYKSDRDFTDSGKFLEPEVQIAYPLSDMFQVFFKYSIRREFLKIEAPEEVQDFFSGNTILFFGIGIRFNAEFQLN